LEIWSFYLSLQINLFGGLLNYCSMGLDLSKGTVRKNLEAGVIEPAMSKVKIIQVNVVEHTNALTNLWRGLGLFPNGLLKVVSWILHWPVCNWSSHNDSSNWWHDQACQRWKSEWRGLGFFFPFFFFFFLN